MINKKLLTVTAVVVALSSSSAFAKTEGNYVGLDFLKSYSVGSGAGVGVDYKYAVNLGSTFFIAPGFFVDRISTKVRDRGNITKLNYRYGLKTDIGYDITDVFSAYATGGIVQVAYKADQGSKMTDGFLYGLGLGYKATNDSTISIEYNQQKNSKRITDLSVVKLAFYYNF